MKTIGAALDQSRGIGPGFDFVRVALAMFILFTHSFLTAEGERRQFSGPLLGVFHDALVPMFFALSGFLITGSALRLSLRNFLLNRSMRIVPALAVDVCVSALILGPVFTTEPLSQYASNYEFRAYFANIVGVIHFVLPGVFAHNPFPNTVNGSLWTVPYEIGCYTIMASLIVLGLLKRPGLVALCAIGVAIGVVFTLTTGFDPLSGSAPLDTFLAHYFGPQGLSLYVAFMVGCLIYLFKHRLPLSGWIAAVCVRALVGAAAAVPTVLPSTICAIGAPFIAYLTVFLGLTPLPKLPLYSRGDYSYGIYLYGFPLQQALAAVAPGLHSPWLHFAICVPLVTLVAMFSWHYVEKPVLGLRKRFSFTARKGDASVVLPVAEQPPT